MRPSVPYLLDTSASPYTRLKPIPLTAVHLADGFWSQRLGLNRKVTLPSQYRYLVDTGRLWNFLLCLGDPPGGFDAGVDENP